MRVDFFLVTIFPDIINCYAKYGILRQAIKKGRVSVRAIDLRDFGGRNVDDTPYGGVPGMVLKPEPIFSAYDYVKDNFGKPYVLLTEPWGEKITQPMLQDLSRKDRVMIICGRYEGVDERVKSIVDMEVSLGDFVLSGGELVALSIVDGVARLLPGVLNEPKSLQEDSFGGMWIGYPVYTRPREFRGMKVPETIISGNHKLIELWKLWHRIENTFRKRPHMIPEDLTPQEEEILRAIKEGLSFEDWVRTKLKNS